MKLSPGGQSQTIDILSFPKRLSISVCGFMSGGRRARGVGADEAIRAFERLGFTLERQSGSHVILFRRSKGQVIIPRHGVLKPGLLLHELRKTGLTWEEFEAAL